MAVGFPTKVDFATGDVLSAQNMNDLSGTVNLLESAQYAAGKNAIINGDFNINQRSFTTTTTEGAFGFDRWKLVLSGGTGTFSAQTFTPGAAPVAGYESTNFARLAVTTGNDNCSLRQLIEDVRTFAGQTVTLSFWAKGTNPTTLGGFYPLITQNFGSGGSTSVNTESATKVVLTANWTRYSITFAIPSISGKTIGTSSYLSILLGQGLNASTESWTLDLWGVQLEEGSTASPFQTATGTKQGELAACQRYYFRAGGNALYENIGSAWASSTTQAFCLVNLPVTQRIASAVIDYSTLALYEGVGFTALTNLTINGQSTNQVRLQATVASGLTQYRPYGLLTNNSLSGYLGFSAEL